MQRQLFAQRLMDAVTHARDFARRFIEEELPDAITLCIGLNASYDGNRLHADEVVFPEDRGRMLADQAAEQAVAVLWREGRVPEWIDVRVFGTAEQRTTIELLCCGRFTENDQLLYHQHAGRPPFHVVGPSLPPGWQEGDRFSLYRDAQCWTRAALEGPKAHASKVWSLRLYGPEFDDACLEHLFPMPNLEVLELSASPLTGSGLRGLVRHPRLRVLRATLSPGARFHCVELPRLAALESVSLRGLPSGRWGFSHLAAVLPSLSRLHLGGTAGLDLEVPLPELDELELSGTKAMATLPRRLETLTLHLREAGDTDVEQLLEPVEQLRSLSLRNTPVTDALVERLAARWPLRYLDMVDTRVTEDAVRRLRAAHPSLKMWPNLDARRLST